MASTLLTDNYSRPGNDSRPVKFQPGTLVKFKIGSRRVYAIDHNSGKDSCWISFDGLSTPVEFGEWQLRTLTFGEFLWYRDPITGNRKIGKNRALPLLFGAAVLIAGCFGHWTVAVLLAAYVGLTILGTHKNYTGKWR